MDKFECVVPSWNDMQNYAKKTAELIKKSRFYPEVIIALSRGGLVPSRLLADFLHIKNVLAIKVDHWGITAAKDGKAKISHGLDKDLSGRKVLIVDDITDTGESMELALQHIKSLNPTEVKTAALIHLRNSKYIPDFYGYERGWAWIIFPWNYMEDLVNLIQKISNYEKKAAEKIREELKENFSIEMDLEELKDILKHIDYVDSIKD